MAKYESKLNKNTKDNANTVKIRDDNEEAKRYNHLYMKNLDEKVKTHKKTWMGE